VGLALSGRGCSRDRRDEADQASDRPVLVDLDDPYSTAFAFDATVVDLASGDVVVPIRRVSRD
jgi:hypothetical protein